MPPIPQGPPVAIPEDDLFFHPLQKIRDAARADDRTKEIEGSGSERLETPGLKKVESIKTRGGAEIPMSEDRRYPGDIATIEGTGWNWKVKSHAHFRHVKNADENYILRSKLSDGVGVWPKADSFSV